MHIVASIDFWLLVPSCHTILIFRIVSIHENRGRFSVVRKCIQKCSGREFAAKYINKKLVMRQDAETEYNTLQSLQHEYIVRSLDIYDTPTSHLLIMELWVVFSQSMRLFNTRAETIHGTHDTIHITIHDPQYDTYHNIIFLWVFEKLFELNAATVV